MITKAEEIKEGERLGEMMTVALISVAWGPGDLIWAVQVWCSDVQSGVIVLIVSGHESLREGL